MKEKILKVGNVAAILGVNPETIRRWDRSGKFKADGEDISGHRLYKYSRVQARKKVKK